MRSTVIVIPCYDEEQRLAVDEFARFARASDCSLLFVNDGSQDGTDVLLAHLTRESDDRIDAVTLPRNRGKGAAVYAGLKEAVARGAEVVAYVDADLSTPLAEIERLIAVREESGADVVLGSRVALLGHQIRRSPMRHYLGRIFATVASLMLGQPVYDTQCGAKVFLVSPVLEQALAEPFRTRWVFDVELLSRMFAANQSIRCLEVPLLEWRDVDGSKLTPRRMLAAGRELLSLRRR